MNKTHRNPHFLLVEDCEDHALIIQRYLLEAPTPLVLARVHDGLEMLKYLRHEGLYKNAPTPNLILMDLNLPKMSGHEVLEELKKDAVLKQIPVVILSTSNAKLDVEKAYSLHANSYLVKPMDSQDLKQMLFSLVEYWGRWNE